MITSLRMLSEIQKLKEQLPGIDCGSCGAPNCRAFAEDVIKETAELDDCLIKRYGKKGGDGGDS